MGEGGRKRRPFRQPGSSSTHETLGTRPTRKRLPMQQGSSGGGPAPLLLSTFRSPWSVARRRVRCGLGRRIHEADWPGVGAGPGHGTRFAPWARARVVRRSGQPTSFAAGERRWAEANGAREQLCRGGGVRRSAKAGRARGIVAWCSEDRLGVLGALGRRHELQRGAWAARRSPLPPWRAATGAPSASAQGPPQQARQPAPTWRHRPTLCPPGPLSPANDVLISLAQPDAVLSLVPTGKRCCIHQQSLQKAVALERLSSAGMMLPAASAALKACRLPRIQPVSIVPALFLLCAF